MRLIPAENQCEDASRKKEVVGLWFQLASCERSIEQRLRSHLSENFAVTLPQFEVLNELDRNGAPIVMSRLSEQLKVTGSNLTGVVDRLERKGFVKRFRSSSDRRIQRIGMTSTGRATYANIAADNVRWISRAFMGLTDKEIAQLRKLLLKVSLSVSKSLT